MSEFKREERYMVLKLSRLPSDEAEYLRDCMKSAMVECVVIEKDWPEFEPTWAAIEARMTGQPSAAEQSEAKSNQHKLAMDAACGEIALLKEELETYQMSISHQMVRSVIKAFTGEAASGVAAACKTSTESGIIATLECAQGDLRQAMQIIEKQKALLRDWYAANADGRIQVDDEAYHIVISTAQLIDSDEASQ